jgi:polysaccharide deacetylase family protein (PEP-CTERM system associated)
MWGTPNPARGCDPVAQWATRLADCALPLHANALTVDVEDYFQVEAFFKHVDRKRWDNYECRIERNVERILELFDEANAKATFFTLGWIAERYPALVRRIVASGHELASHGHAHLRADQLSREEFLDDIGRAKRVLEDIAGQAVLGYRAPSFSVSRKNLWALDAIEAAGYRYSSSIYPIAHDLYGIPDAPRFAFHPLPESPFLEIPVSSVRALGSNWPCGGGGYFRLLPFWLSVSNLARINRRESRPCMFYFHPWEIDPGQPRIPGVSLKTKIRHYTNLCGMESRLIRLLAKFRWDRIDRIFPVEQGHAGAAP